MKKSTFYQVPLILQSILETNNLFLFPPSWFFLTTNTNNSFPYCSIDDAFHRYIKVSFADGKLIFFKSLPIITRTFGTLLQTFEFISGSHLHITEKASDESIQLNGTYPDDYQFEQEIILTETVVQTQRGMLVASR